MKIAIFHELPPGGARIATHEIAKGLKKRHEVDLYYVDNKKNGEEERIYSKSFFYKFVPKVWQGNNWKIRLYKDSLELYNLYTLHKKIAKDIKKRKYDLMFVNASKFIESPFILRFSNTKKVFYLHDPHDRSLYEKTLIRKKKNYGLRRVYEQMALFIRKKLDKQNLYGGDVFLANSLFTQKMFKKTYGKKSTVAYLGVDTEFFNPQNVEKEFDVLYIGSRQPVDNYPLLEKALPLIKKKIIVREVFFEDEWLSASEMRNLYRKSKLVVALGKSEPFGLIPLEAMACGVPVIAVNEGGYKETIINGKNGYLISRNPEELAKKIENLMNEKKRKEIGEFAREYVKKRWTWQNRIQELEKTLEKIAE